MYIHRPHKSRAKVVRAVAALLTAAAAAAIPALPHTAAFAAGCGANPGEAPHWRAVALSGSGSTVIGTQLFTTTPLHWSVGANNSTSDEAAWLRYANDPASSVEGGFYTGFWPYNSGGFTNGLLPYATTGNGIAGAQLPGGYVPANSGVILNVRANDSNGTTVVSVNGGSSALGYSVQSPRQNYAQGEVTQTSSTWMGGGSASEPFNAYWQDANGTYAWGSHSDCVDPPYYLNSTGANSWNNGGV